MKKTPIPTSGRLSDLPPVAGYYFAALRKYNVEKPWVKEHPQPIFPEPGQGLVTLGGVHKFYVTKSLYEGSPRQRMYGIIIEALERGLFSRLRFCAECHLFFVAADLRQKFCTSNCMELADKRRAVERVRKMRARNKRAVETARRTRRSSRSLLYQNTNRRSDLLNFLILQPNTSGRRLNKAAFFRISKH